MKRNVTNDNDKGENFFFLEATDLLWESDQIPFLADLSFPIMNGTGSVTPRTKYSTL